MISKTIYLDYNATTPVDPRVLDVMLPYFTEKFGNASSNTHPYGWDAEEAVDQSREQIADLIGAKPNELTFTSGATEAINLALQGYCQANRQLGNHLITCQTEHKAVLDTCQQLEKQGFEITYLPVDRSGNIHIEELEACITQQTILASFMLANNETGVVHPLKKISAITRKHGIILMTDATQAVGKLDLNFRELGVDLAAFSAHKIYGPKGVGALYVSRKSKPGIRPQLFGGGQESRLRPGTLNVPGIVGFGKACEIILSELEKDSIRWSELRAMLENELRDVEGVIINGADSERIPNTINLSIENIDGGKLIRSLKNLAVSQGSACTSTIIEPSHVLTSMGLPDELALSSVRISMGRFTTAQEVKAAIEAIRQVTTTLRLSTP